LTDVCVKIHPELGVLVGTDGHVMVPGDKFHKPHWTRGSRMKNGYFSVCAQGHRNLLVHRLVLETFVGPCPDGFECNHKNRDRTDNRLENLEWVTHRDNMRNTSQNDRCFQRLGIHHYDDPREANRVNHAVWYSNNKEVYNARRRAERLIK
jgi:hypothetical protein